MSIEEQQASALSRLPRDIAIIKMECDTIMAAATARPRDHAAMLKDIKTQLATIRGRTVYRSESYINQNQ